MENYNKYIELFVDHIMETRDQWDVDPITLKEIISNHCDGSQLVMHYSQAHDFLKWLPCDVISDAEQKVADYSCGEFIIYSEHVSLVACFALEKMVFKELQERLDKAEEAA